jgi:ubiquitin carboxyl-terminal hydrolase 9/24
MLEGDNAYFCEKCDKKRDTLRRCSFKRLPNVLFLDLKRFEFNFDTMSKFKVNDYCAFPNELDMKKYTQEYLKRQDLLKEMEEKNISYEDLDQDQQAIYNK